MKITVISRSWPSNENSGVPMVAAQHVKLLADEGFKVSIVGSSQNVLKEKLPVLNRFYIRSKGSGSFYSPASVDLIAFSDAIDKSAPDLIIVEAWQTALTDAAIDLAFKKGIPVLMISHGISVYSYSNTLLNMVRSLAWIFYRIYSLPRRIAKLSAITTLDDESTSNRFYDRDLARGMGIPVVRLINAPVNWRNSTARFDKRKRQILVIGYFSSIKNQLGALDIFAGLPDSLQLRFIGQRSGSYYLKCLSRVAELGLGKRVIFSQDNECSIADEIADSLLVLCTSITEALPVTILEAMASGTPFVASSVGAISALGAGVVVDGVNQQRAAILNLISDASYWTCLSEEGLRLYEERFTIDHVRRNLFNAIEVSLKSRQLSPV